MRTDGSGDILSTMNADELKTRRLTRALEGAAEVDFEIDVAGMARLAGYSTGHFQRIFRHRFGISPGRFLRHERIDRFAELLRAGQNVTQAAVEAGFLSSSRAHQAARDGLGMLPSQLSGGAKGTVVHYATSACRMGRVLVAATERGLCAVLLGDEDATIREELGNRFPKAVLVAGGAAFETSVKEVVSLIDGSAAPSASLPLDLHGTVFQRQVWDALQDIPAGRTITYGELARRVGLPGGARAVAQACGANPAAVVVPCHRVVAADGGLGGYRWGTERKRALLEREQAEM